MGTQQLAALFLARQPDSVRWLPASSPVDPLRPLVCATWDWTTCTARLEGMVLSTVPEASSGRDVQASPFSDEVMSSDAEESGAVLQAALEWGLPSRCSTNVCVVPLGDDSRQTLIVAGTCEGDLIAGIVDPWNMASGIHNNKDNKDKDKVKDNPKAAPSPSKGQVAASIPRLHSGAITAVDFQRYSKEVLTAGEDGRLLTLRVEKGGTSAAQALGMPDGSDMAGVGGYTSATWLSPSQSVCAVLGGGLKWWDTRQSTKRPSALSPLEWKTPAPGALTAFHVHPSRQHLLVAGGSCGTLLAWDMRSISSPLVLSGDVCLPCTRDNGVPKVDHSSARKGLELSTADVLDVRFDPLLNLGEVQRPRSDAMRLPPVLACTGDGALSVVNDGNVADLFVGTSAVCSFDVEPDFGQHVICAMDHECLSYLYRARIF